MDPSLVAAAPKRTEAENALRALTDEASNHARSVAAEAAQLRSAGDFKGAAGVEEAIEVKRAEWVARANDILAGGLPTQHADYLRRHGCTAHTAQALATCAAEGPLLEAGAGAGHWAKALRALGVDVQAVDVRPPPSAVTYVMITDAVNVVREDGAQAASAKNRRPRTLLLVYPGPGPFAGSCLREYRGDVLLYAGEARGGCNADDAFFDELEAAWDITRTVPLEPFTGGHERLYVLRRRDSTRRAGVSPLVVAAASSAALLAAVAIRKAAARD